MYVLVAKLPPPISERPIGYSEPSSEYNEPNKVSCRVFGREAMFIPALSINRTFKVSYSLMSFLFVYCYFGHKWKEIVFLNLLPCFPLILLTHRLCFLFSNFSTLRTVSQYVVLQTQFL